MNVLIVDDHPINRRLLRAMLEAEGVGVCEAADGREALAVLEAHPVDAIVSDILMPNMDGYRFCYEVRHSPRFQHLPFVFYTSTYTSSADEKLAREIGGDAFILKPAGAKRILGVLHEICTRPRPQAAADDAAPHELEVMKHYSEQLVAKLEAQNADLRQRTAELEREITERKRAQQKAQENIELAARSRLALLGAMEDQQRAEAGLRASDARIRNVFEQASDGIYIISAANRYLDANTSGLKMLGWTRDELLQMSVADALAPHEVARLAVEPPQMMSGTPHLAEWNYVRKDGSSFPGEVSARRLDEYSYLTIVRDLTARREAENLLREAESRLRLSVTASNIGLWDWSLVTNEIYFSREWKSQLGYSEDEISNRFEEWESRLHPDDLAPTLAKVRAFIENSTAEYKAEFRLRHKDGSWRWIFTQAQIFRDADGKPMRMMGCHIDISERKRAEQALREHAQQLQAVSHKLITVQEEERRMLARELHDEVGQTLSALKINLQVIERRSGAAPLASNIAECVQIADQALARVRALMFELRSPQLDELGLAVALRTHAQRQTAVAGLSVHFSAPEALPQLDATVEISCFRIAQGALINVLRHAGAKSVWVELTVDGDELRLTVRDDGRGFDLAAARMHAAHGVSLGLISMEERAALAGGRIKIVTALGAGTTVQAVFALSNPPHNGREAPAA